MKIGWYKSKIEITQRIKGSLKSRKIKVWYNFNLSERERNVDLNIGDIYMFIIGEDKERQKKMILNNHTWFKVDKDQIFISGGYFKIIRRDGSEKSEKLKQNLIKEGYVFTKTEFVRYMDLLNKTFTRMKVKVVLNIYPSKKNEMLFIN